MLSQEREEPWSLLHRFPSQVGDRIQQSIRRGHLFNQWNLIRSLKHLVEVLRDLKDDLIVIHYDQRWGETMVLPRKAMIQETEVVLSDNGIRSQGSADMMAVWRRNKAHRKGMRTRNGMHLPA